VSGRPSTPARSPSDYPRRLRELVDARRGEESEREKASANDSNGHHPDEPPPDRPTIDAGDADLERTSAHAWAALTRANTTPYLFRFGGTPVRLEGEEDDATPVAQPLTVDRLSHELARCATWVRYTEKGTKPAAPPSRLLKDLLAAPAYPFPPLLGISQVPVFAADGALSTVPGYHAASRTYYAPPRGLTVAAVPETPTSADVEDAKHLIVDDLLGEFCFTGEAERANATALFLDRYVRTMIPGPTPLRLIEAPTPGSGKGLLADVLLRPAIGRRVSVMPAATDDNEWRKRLTAQLMLMPEAILIDNVVAALDSGSLSAALTADWWTDRVLGASEMTRLPIRTTWIATANNPTMSTELARRTVRIRLDPQVDRPWQRTGFQHPDLREWTDAHRAELVRAALVLGRHWVLEGSPAGKERLGSYEHWSAVLGGILGCAGITGFLGNLDAFYEEADLEGAVWRQFVAAWFAKHGNAEVAAADLFDVAMTVDGFDFGGKPTERAQKTAFGIALNRQRDRVIGGFRVLNTRTVHRLKQWRLLPTNAGDPFATFYQDQPADDTADRGEPGADEWTA
jgi:hypothetical protein